MHDEAAGSEPDPLHDAYRVVRALAPAEAPFAGALARTADDRMVVLVPAGELGEWPGWSADSDGHVLAATDLARTQEGAMAELPWCPETVEAFLARRVRNDAPLTAGEAVTLAVSVVRALGELRIGRTRGSPPPSGRWWLTDAARPVFAVDAGAAEPADDAATRVLRAAAAACDRPDVAAVLERVADDPSLAARGSEAELFRLASPEALDTTADAGTPVPGVRRGRVTDIPPEPEAVSRLRGVIDRHIDADIAELVSASLDRVRARVTTARVPRGRRAGPIAAAVVVAVLAVVAGLLWPTGDPAPAQTAPSASTMPSASAPAPAAAASETAAAAPTAQAAGDDPVARADDLFDALASCPDDACRAVLIEDPALYATAGSIAAGPRRLTLLDDFGDVAALRVDTTSAEGDVAGPAPHRIVIARGDGGWRLRALYSEEGATP